MSALNHAPSRGKELVIYRGQSRKEQGFSTEQNKILGLVKNRYAIKSIPWEKLFITKKGESEFL
jgi:hypothetical protein